MQTEKIYVMSYVFNMSNTARAFAVYNTLNNNKYDVRVIYANYDHYSKEHVKYDNGHFIDVKVPAYRKNMSLMRISSTIIYAIKSISIIKKDPPSLVYVICPPNFGSFLTSIVCKKMSIPCILDIVDLHPESIPISKKKYKLLYYLGLNLWIIFRDIAVKNASKVIVECNYYNKAIKDKFKDKTSTLYLTKQSSSVNYIHHEKNNDTINILYLGSIGHIYDFDSLIKIGEKLSKMNISYKLHIVGDGEKRDWLLKELKTKSLHYIYYGKIYDEYEKQKITALCDFGFNGFRIETSVALSYKSIDYMDYGLAIINSTKEDTWNLIKNNNAGINYCSNNIDNLIQQIIHLQKIDIDTMKTNSRKLYELYFSESVFENNLMREIDELL